MPVDNENRIRMFQELLYYWLDDKNRSPKSLGWVSLLVGKAIVSRYAIFRSCRFTVVSNELKHGLESRCGV